MSRNGVLLRALFVAFYQDGLRPLAPLASGQYPLLRIFSNHTGTIEGADAKSFAGTIFLMYGLGLNSSSTCCVIILTYFPQGSYGVSAQCATYSKIKGFLFCPFEPPSKRKYDTNDISFESPDIGLLESKTKLGVASSRGRHWPIN